MEANTIIIQYILDIDGRLVELWGFADTDPDFNICSH